MTHSIERDVDIANQRVAAPPISGNMLGPHRPNPGYDRCGSVTD